MAITITTTTSGESSNSYITLAEANSYFEIIPWFYSIWLEIFENEKNARIVQAARTLDRLNFDGEKYVEEQKMEFPRDITDADTDDGVIPQKIKDAQCELIIWQYQHIDSSTGQIDRQVDEFSQNSGEISIKFRQTKDAEYSVINGVPENIRRMLRTWVVSNCVVSIDRI